MISGKYVGELARLAMKSLIKDGGLFGGKSSDRFDKFLEFDTKFVSMIEAR
jgi:hexokinase